MSFIDERLNIPNNTAVSHYRGPAPALVLAGGDVVFGPESNRSEFTLFRNLHDGY